MQESAHKVRKSTSQVVISKMQPALHATRRTPHGASRLVQAMPVWSAKIRRAPSRHCRDARVIPLWSYHYGHAQTEYTRPPPKTCCLVGENPDILIVGMLGSYHYGHTTTAMHEVNIPHTHIKPHPTQSWRPRWFTG